MMRRVCAARAPAATLLRQLGRSRACVSQQLMSMLRPLREICRQSLRHLFCPSTVRLPCHNSLNNICFGSRLSGILKTCPAHLACAFCWRVKTLGMSARSRTSMSGILSCHLIRRSLRRQLR